MANYDQLNTIGSGAYFPIKLSTKEDDSGNPEQVVIGTNSYTKSFDITNILLEKFGESGGNERYVVPTELVENLWLMSSDNLNIVVNRRLREPHESFIRLIYSTYLLVTAPIRITLNTEGIPKTTNPHYKIKMNLRISVYSSDAQDTQLNVRLWDDKPHIVKSLFLELTDFNPDSREYKDFNIPLEVDSNYKPKYIEFYVNNPPGGSPDLYVNNIYVEYTINTIAPKVGWYPLMGDISLIKQNLTAILTYQIGQRFRQEDFGSRTWECLEEPNTSALNLMIRNFVKDSISAWEPRIIALKVFTLKPTKESIRLLIYFRVQNSQKVEELNFQYNLNNSTTNVY